jgi:hypothetical protein
MIKVPWNKYHASKGVSELDSVQPLVSVRIEHLKDLSNSPKHLSTVCSQLDQSFFNGFLDLV